MALLDHLCTVVDVDSTDAASRLSRFAQAGKARQAL
jgi:hypothetical protein